MDERTTRNVTQYQKMLLFPRSSKPRKVWNISKFHRDCDRQDHFIVLITGRKTNTETARGRRIQKSLLFPVRR